MVKFIRINASRLTERQSSGQSFLGNDLGEEITPDNQEHPKTFSKKFLITSADQTKTRGPRKLRKKSLQ